MKKKDEKQLIRGIKRNTPILGKKLIAFLIGGGKRAN